MAHVPLDAISEPPAADELQWHAGELAEVVRSGYRTMTDEDDQYSPEETERRRDEAIRRALDTPPKPQKEIIGKSGRPSRKRRPRSRSVEKK